MGQSPDPEMISGWKVTRKSFPGGKVKMVENFPNTPRKTALVDTNVLECFPSILGTSTMKTGQNILSPKWLWGKIMTRKCFPGRVEIVFGGICEPGNIFRVG
jgi:hypothetical protein